MKETIRSYVMKRLAEGVSIKVIFSEWVVKTGKRPNLPYLYSLRAEYHESRGAKDAVDAR